MALKRPRVEADLLLAIDIRKGLDSDGDLHGGRHQAGVDPARYPDPPRERSVTDRAPAAGIGAGTASADPGFLRWSHGRRLAPRRALDPDSGDRRCHGPFAIRPRADGEPYGGRGRAEPDPGWGCSATTPGAGGALFVSTFVWVVVGYGLASMAPDFWVPDAVACRRRDGHLGLASPGHRHADADPAGAAGAGAGDPRHGAAPLPRSSRPC